MSGACPQCREIPEFKRGAATATAAAAAPSDVTNGAAESSGVPSATNASSLLRQQSVQPVLGNDDLEPQLERI